MSASAGNDSGSRLAAARGERGRALLTFLLLLAVVVAIYGRALPAPFIFDDQPGIVENPSLRRLWPLVGDPAARGPLNPPPLAPTNRRPLANLTLALDYHFYGLDPAGFRATNLVLHALAAAVLAALVRRTLRLPYFASPARAAWSLGFATALLWAVHPLASETVVYLTQRTEILAALCYLATLWAALRHWTATSQSAAARWRAVAVGACIAGMASKEVMVSVPLAVWLYERTFLVDSWRATRRSRALYAGLALGWVVLVAVNLGGASGLNDARHYVSLPVWWATQTKVVLLYLKLALWPWPLAIHYAPAYLSTIAAAWPWVLAGSVAVATAGAAVRRRPAARWVVIVMALVLAPTLLVPLPKMMAAERRMYLPLAGLVTLAVVGAHRLLARGGWRLGGRAAAVVALGLALVYATVDLQRLTAYRSAVALWEDTIQTQPTDPMAHYNLGVAFLDAGRQPEAMASFERALVLDPDYGRALDNLGMLLRRAGRPDEARQRLERALVLDPEDAVAHNNLGALLLELGRPADALPHLERALAHEPDQPKATIRRNLGKALVALGRPGEGLAELDQALRLQPDDADALHDRGWALLALGRPAEAIPSFEAALRLRPDDPATENNLAIALLQAGRIEDAIAYLRKSLALEPENVGARNNLGTALRSVGRTPEAIAEFGNVLVRDPANVTARFNLGSALLDGGQPGEAAKHFEAVLRQVPDDAQVRFKCAIAYVQSGRRAEGVAMAEAALQLARDQAATALAGDIDTWLAGYRR